MATSDTYRMTSVAMQPIVFTCSTPTRNISSMHASVLLSKRVSALLASLPRACRITLSYSCPKGFRAAVAGTWSRYCRRSYTLPLYTNMVDGRLTAAPLAVLTVILYLDE